MQRVDWPAWACADTVCTIRQSAHSVFVFAGIDDIRLDIHEDSGCIGPTKGCVKGCAEYYCACKGCIALCCPTDHKMKTVAEMKEEQKQAEENATAQP